MKSLKCKNCNCDNKFDSQKMDTYVDGCSYTCEVNYGISFNCESCKKRNVHLVYSELNKDEYNKMEGEILKYQQSQKLFYKIAHFFKLA